jgi:hypothetical protein
MTATYALIDAIRTLRKERGLPFEQARDESIEHFKRMGYELPSWAKRKHDRYPGPRGGA